MQACAFGTFLSHAGAQKRIFVDYVYRDLREVPGAHPFLDEFDIQSGTQSWEQIERALEEAPVGALAPSAAGVASVSQITCRNKFLRAAHRYLQVSSCCQRRLCGPKRRCASSAWLCDTGRQTAKAGPWCLSFWTSAGSECKTMRQRYSEPGFWVGWEKPEPAVLDGWAADLELPQRASQACDPIRYVVSFGICTDRDHVTDSADARANMDMYQLVTFHHRELHALMGRCRRATSTRLWPPEWWTAAIEQLKELGRVQRSYSHTPRLGPPMLAASPGANSSSGRIGTRFVDANQSKHRGAWSCCRVGQPGRGQELRRV